jgi:hypothetical protein
MDAVIAIMEVAAACPRSAEVVQFGNFGPIRTFAEYGTPAEKARWLGDLLAGRTVMSLGTTEPDAGSALTDLKTSARGRRRPLHYRRRQGVLDLQSGCADFPHLCAIWPRRRRHWVSSGRTWNTRILRWRAGDVHERRAMVRIAFCRLPYSGRKRAAGAGRLQEANVRIQRRAPRQHRPFARLRPLCVQCGARLRLDAPPVRPPAV